jgi:outer membrane receptor protein involved in Fe transport
MIVGAATLFASAAMAQPTQSTEVEGVVITGSRIPQPNMTSVSPVQVVTSEEFAQTGQTDTVDLLNDLPMVFQNDQAGFSSTSNPLSNPGGVATVDLRGIGPQRTLVLVDGRRLGLGDPNTGSNVPAPDINQIPSALVERVDVLTGGASAAYGSDAIAGVVNFIMRRNFSGLEIDLQSGIYQHGQHNDYIRPFLAARGIAVPDDKWDGRYEDVSVIFGMNSADGNGNVTGYFVYHDQEPVIQKARDFSACQHSIPANAALCAGSANSNQWYLTANNPFAVVGTQFVPYDQNNLATTPAPLFNSNDFAYLLHGDTRYTGGYMAHYEINPHFDVYSDFQFMGDRGEVIIAPSGLFQQTGPGPGGAYAVNCNNPLMSLQQQQTFCGVNAGTPTQVNLQIGRRNIEGGGRVQSYNHDVYRGVVGTRGEIVGSWRYDVYGSYYYTSFFQSSDRYLSVSRIQNSLLVGGTAANPVCLSGGTCVPYNIFRDGGVTQAALDYLNTRGTASGSFREIILEGVVTGDLGDYGLKSPWANDGVGIAVGVHNRRDRFVYAPDAALLSGDLSGAGGASVSLNRTLRVTEGFGELRVPVVQDHTFFQELTLEAGYRYSDYSTGITADTYKLGLQWAPTDWIRLRASFQSAIRAPSLLELYKPQSVTNTSQLSVDPCAPLNGAAATATLAQCQAQGVTAAQYGNGLTTNTIPQCVSGQCSVLTGGNPNLSAEQADTYAVGFTVRPSGFLEGFTGSVDYYNIRLTNLVGALPLGLIMTNCLAGQTFFCGMIHRNSLGAVNGTVLATAGYLVGTNVNVGAGRTSGVDFQANYRLPLERLGAEDWGSTLDFQFAGSYLIEATTTPRPGDPTYDCAGLYGPQCQTVAPTWRHTARVTWNMPWHLETSLSWRYLGDTLLETQSTEPTIGNKAALPAGDIRTHLESRSYFDVSAQWQVWDRYTFRAGIANILDTDPPLTSSQLAQTGMPNTYTIYDLLGRRMFIGLTATF